MRLSEPRILLAVSSLSAGGSERVVSEMSNSWAERGWTIAVLTLSGRNSDHYVLDVRARRIPLDMLSHSHSICQAAVRNARRAVAIRQAVRDFVPDVVVSFIEQTNIQVLCALLGAGIPTIVSERVDPRQHRIGRLWGFARRALYPLAYKVVVQTDSVASWARSFLPMRKVEVIPNFVRALPDVPSFEQRASHEILAVGRLTSQKGFDLLLRAFAVAGLMKRGGRLTILGEGPERPLLGSLARELGIAEVVSMPGVVRHPAHWMARCALFVLPSRFEGFPNALLEAMAMGCAVIAADCPSGPREVIRDGENGLLVPLENVDALAAALSKLIDDGTLRRRLGDEATEVHERYARDAIIGRWDKLILDCIGDQG